LLVVVVVSMVVSMVVSVVSVVSPLSHSGTTYEWRRFKGPGVAPVVY
jgi:hypothetical protein